MSVPPGGPDDVRGERATRVLADVLTFEPDLLEFLADVRRHGGVHTPCPIGDFVVALQFREQILLADDVTEIAVDPLGDVVEVLVGFRLRRILRACLVEFSTNPDRLERQRFRFHGESDRVSVAIEDRAAHRRIDEGGGALRGGLGRQCRRIESLYPEQLCRDDRQGHVHQDAARTVPKTKCGRVQTLSSRPRSICGPGT